MIDFSQIKLGLVVLFNKEPCVVTKCDFVKMNRGKPVKQTVLKNLVNGNNYNYTYKSGENVEEADLRKEKGTFMYASSEGLTFMLSSTYETIEIHKEVLGDKADYLKEGLEVMIVFFDEKAISIDLPIKIDYKIIKTDPAVKGNSVSNITKDAKIETGRVVKVPAFIEIGDRVLVNTVEDSYVERFKS